MKYEYQVVNLRAEIQKIRDSEVPRHNEGDEILLIEIYNKYGREGWRITNPGSTSELYLERQNAD
jgi:hypothetical protein